MSAAPNPTAAVPIKVRIIDLSADSDDNVVEEVGPFASIADANLFARRYVRDSVERCRAPGMEARAVLDAWFAFGEDAVVPDAGEQAWTSATELHDFAARRAKPLDRNWRALDPRLKGPADADDSGGDDSGEEGA
jgi:hypothetical protein